MTNTNHYKEAENALSRGMVGPHASPQALAKAQLHAMLAVADELRDIHNELIEMRGIIARPHDTRANSNI